MASSGPLSPSERSERSSCPLAPLYDRMNWIQDVSSRHYCFPDLDYAARPRLTADGPGADLRAAAGDSGGCEALEPLGSGPRELRAEPQPAAGLPRRRGGADDQGDQPQAAAAGQPAVLRQAAHQPGDRRRGGLQREPPRPAAAAAHQPPLVRERGLALQACAEGEGRLPYRPGAAAQRRPVWAEHSG